MFSPNYLLHESFSCTILAMCWCHLVSCTFLWWETTYSQNTGTRTSSFLLSFFPCTCHVLLCIWSIALACAGRGITISPMLTSSFYALGKRPQPLASAGKASPRQCPIEQPCFYTRMDLGMVKLITGSFSQYTLV